MRIAGNPYEAKHNRSAFALVSAPILAKFSTFVARCARDSLIFFVATIRKVFRASVTSASPRTKRFSTGENQNPLQPHRGKSTSVVQRLQASTPNQRVTALAVTLSPDQKRRSSARLKNKTASNMRCDH